MTGSNARTLLSYDERVEAYVDGTSQEVSGPAKDWLDEALQGLPLDARLLELGSAFGRDAAYIQALGYSLDCTDAVPGFVELLTQRGYQARLLNLLTDDLIGPIDLIIANAVLLHFTHAEFSQVLAKIKAALGLGGRFAFSLKAGQGEGWSVEKIGAPRYFCYWTPEALGPSLKQAGFSNWRIAQAQTTRAHADWLFVIAQ
jgi:SAM-dependent methyltransferase